MLVGRGLAAVHGKFVSPVGVQAWFKGGAANCGYKWREAIDCGEIGCRGRVVESWSDGVWEVDLPFATGFFQRPDDVPRYLEAVCNPNDCERAENLCCQPHAGGSFLPWRTSVSIVAVNRLPPPPAALELDFSSTVWPGGRHRFGFAFSGVYELDGVSNGFPKWRSRDFDDLGDLGIVHSYVHRDTSGHWRVCDFEDGLNHARLARPLYGDVALEGMTSMTAGALLPLGLEWVVCEVTMLDGMEHFDGRHIRVDVVSVPQRPITQFFASSAAPFCARKAARRLAHEAAQDAAAIAWLAADQVFREAGELVERSRRWKAAEPIALTPADDPPLHAPTLTQDVDDPARTRGAVSSGGRRAVFDRNGKLWGYRGMDWP